MTFFAGETVPRVAPAKSLALRHDAYMTLESNPEKPSKQPISDTGSDDDDDDVPRGGIIHTLDLPVLNEKLPREVLITILQLLRPQQQTNFDSEAAEGDLSLQDTLASKSVDSQQYERSVQWLASNGYTKLSERLSHIRFMQDFFPYLNKVLSSCFSADEEILQLASLRISENCGRTARPNFQRRIRLRGFDPEILLNEPALTADSLGLKTWGSSLVLSELVVAGNERLIMDPVLELGAGTGLVGITIGLLGHSVTLTDLPEIMPNLEKNVEINGLNHLHCHVLDWTDPSSFIKECGDVRYNTIVVADPIYSPEHPRWVVNMMTKFLAQSPEARVLLQIPIRNMFDRERDMLWRILEQEKLRVVDDRLMDGFDDFGAQQFIYKELRWLQELWT